MGKPVRRVLGDRYELVELLATGGMGRVWRARDMRLGRAVAVKVLRSEYTDDPVSLARFRAEAQVSARLDHRNIAALHDYGETSGPDGEVCAYLVMELVEGESLAARLAREPRLPLELVLDVVDETAAALAAAHAAGVVHRDVKPGNVLLGADGVVRITDFGIAWSTTSMPLTGTGQVVGTAAYLAPEQAEGRQATPASDVYALGMVAYECLAGGRAFDGDNPVQIALRQIREAPAPLPDDVPEQVRRFVDRALAKDPAERFADGAAVRDAVADVRAGRPLDPVRRPPTRPFPRPVSSSSRRRGRRLLAPMAALLVGVGLGIGALQLAAGPTVVPPAAAAESEVPESEEPESEAVGVEVVAAEFVGRPAGEVEAELVRRGLRVARVEETTTRAAPGLVTAVGPAGRLASGTVVTLTVAVAPPPPPVPGTDAVPGTDTAPGTPASVPAAPPPAPVTAAGAPPPDAGSGGEVTGGGEPGNAGNGNGNGGGNGNGNGGGNGNGNGGGNGNGNGGNGNGGNGNGGNGPGGNGKS